MNIRILINHLTRLRDKYCIAGIGIDDRRHYRPKLVGEYGGIPVEYFENKGGFLALRNIIEFSQVEPKPEGAQSENIFFKKENIKLLGKVPHVEFWDWLYQSSNDSVGHIISDLEIENTIGFVNEGFGSSSLGVLKPRKIGISGSPEKLRITILDKKNTFNMPVTDSRFFDFDGIEFKPKYEFFKETISNAQKAVEDGEVLLSIGLTSPYLHFDAKRYWLQANNIFLKPIQ